MKLAIVALLLLVDSCSCFRIDRIFDEDSDSEAKWLFYGNWEEKVEGKLEAGEKFQIVYNNTRLPYRSYMYGQRAWDIYVNYKLNDGDKVYEEKLDGPEPGNSEIMTKTIFLPYGTSSITAWFKSWSYNDGYNYDSDYGKNYREQVSAPQENTIVFESDWSENVYGELEEEHEFTVMYSPKRLGEGNKVTAVAKFGDSDETHERKLEEAGNGYLTTTYKIPEDADKVIMWFYTGEGDDRKWDSNYSKNYEFSVEKE